MYRFFKINTFYYSILLIGLYIIISIIYNHAFVTETYLSQLYEGILSKTQILESVSFVKKWEWGIVLLNVVFVFIKIIFVATCLYLGLFFFNQNYSFKISFNIALKAEIIFVLYTIIRLLWIGFIYTPESIEEMQIMPLSLMHFFDPTKIESWLVYPLNTINVFEVIYIWMLSSLVAVAIKTNFRKAFDLVFVSYGAGLLLLIVAQMFFILNNS
jgi:hypothetical protein